MKKVFILLILLAFASPAYAVTAYKWVDKKGTIHFSDNRTSLPSPQEKGSLKEDGIAVLKRSEENKRRMVVVSEGKTLRIYGVPQTTGGSGSSQATSGRS